MVANQGCEAKKGKKLIAFAQIFVSKPRQNKRTDTINCLANVLKFLVKVFEKCGKDWSRAKCSL